MKKFLICFICIFSITAHADHANYEYLFRTDKGNNDIPVYINIDGDEPRNDFKCYKEIDTSRLKLSGGNYNEVLLHDSSFAEIASENNNQIKIMGMLCGYNPNCPVGTIYIGYAALGSSAATKYAAFVCNEYSTSDRNNYEWVEYNYKEECLVPDDSTSTPITIIDGELYFYDDAYCRKLKNIASQEYVDDLINNLPNNANTEYINTLHNIQTSMTTLSAFYAGLERNVWRNEDGKFNTARLVSDATAGVVLGTAGGLISNKLIKKNQVRKGFDGISCYVGGQLVADYGDEFTVGMN